MEPVAAPSRLSLYLDLIRWNRPAGSYLLLWPTLSALWLAAGGFPGWHLLAVFTLGTVLMRSAGCAVNDVADRRFDRHVKRTAARPVTSGAILPREALAVGAALAFIAFLLVLTTNRATVLWSVAALAVTVIYPYTKRFFSMPQAVLGVAFSFGIPMAFSAVRGEVPPVAWALLVGNLFWVLAYDTEYAMVDRDDDLKIGIRTSAITARPFRCGGGDGVLLNPLDDLVGSRHFPWSGSGLRRRPVGGCGAGGMALHADSRSLARGLLQGLSAEPLDRLRGVCRHRAGHAAAPRGSVKRRSCASPRWIALDGAGRHQHPALLQASGNRAESGRWLRMLGEQLQVAGDLVAHQHRCFGCCAACKAWQ